MSWLSTLHRAESPKRERVKAKPRSEYRLDESVKARIRMEVEERNRLVKELESYTYAAIAKRHGIHERSVPKVAKL